MPSLEHEIASLPRDKTPHRDLWQGIEFAISDEQTAMPNKAMQSSKRKHLPSLAIAASIFMVCIVSYFSYESGKNVSGQLLVQQMADQHRNLKNSLLTSFQDKAATTANWQQQLAELDEAALAIKKALENEPNNAALLNMLKRVHQQQIALIERVHAPAWQQI